MASKQPQCRDCRASVVWFLDAHTGKWRKFDPYPVDVRSGVLVRPAYPVEGRRVWRTVLLVEELRVRRECTREEAEGEVYDMPWHVPHDCPKNPFRPREEDTR